MQTPTEETPAERELRLELEARTAEADWLRTHYEDHLRRAYARIAELETQVEAGREGAAARVDSVPRAAYERLRAEADRLAAAERRYIDRIEELKHRLAGTD
jgi:hypothetical protein